MLTGACCVTQERSTRCVRPWPTCVMDTYSRLQAYLVTLVDGREVIARVARRFMPRLKTESEVATMAYLRTHTKIPVPTVFFYDANPYNRLGGEYIIMSKVRAGKFPLYPCQRSRD